MAGAQRFVVLLALVLVCSVVSISAYVIPDPCSPSNPCTNGGECQRLGKGSEFSCHCPRGYVGRLCQNNVLSAKELVTLIDARLDVKLGELANRLEAVYNASRYNGLHVFYERQTWQGAKTRCSERGGHLAVPRSSEEQDRVVGQLNADQFSGQTMWLGATDAETEGVWKDVYGRQVSYFVWSTNEPTNRGGDGTVGEHCLQTYSPGLGGQWNDARCHLESTAYLCRF